MIHSKHYNLESAKAAAMQASVEHPGHYVILVNCFGLEVEVMKRLRTFAPSDSFMGCRSYWLNGREKPFTDRQVIADQRATPALS